MLSHVTSDLGQARGGQRVQKGNSRWQDRRNARSISHCSQGGPLCDKQSPSTHPDFVILRLVLQILIKFLLGVELNAIYFKLLSNLGVRKRSKVAKRQDNGWMGGAEVRGRNAAFENPIISELRGSDQQDDPNKCKSWSLLQHCLRRGIVWRCSLLISGSRRLEFRPAAQLSLDSTWFSAHAAMYSIPVCKEKR